MTEQAGETPKKRRILFVDDEPCILDGLRNLLRRQRRRWEMTFVESGEQALQELQSAPFDVIVSDMRMPGMDGATLLARVHDEHPRVARIVLSGYAELEAAMRAVPVAHQFLTKPCDPDLLEQVIERACGLQRLLGDANLRALVGRIQTLPALPRVYQQLLSALADPRVDADAVTRVLEQDLAMCAKLLQLVNSAFFRMPRRIASVKDAVSYLGFNMVKHLALSVEVFHGGDAPDETQARQLQQHGLATARLAARIAGAEQRDDAFVAGLLHDIGKLVLARECAAVLARARAEARASEQPLHVVETRLNGVSHAEVGAYLLGLWGLPYPIVEAVANHHAPARVAATEPGVLGAVHVADALVGERVPADPGACPPAGLDRAFVEQVGLADDIERWRDAAAAAVG